MDKQLLAKYDHLKVEENYYKEWINAGYFKAGDKSKDPFCIVIPPPNVTGKLHLGHAWDTTLQDIIARYKRLQGYDMLWLPGMDHAGIATQAKVDERLKGEGISRYDIGREKFLERAWQWKEEYAQTIRTQWGKIGLSLDYSRERFTLDEGLNKAVKKVFIDLYKEGLIYQGERIINWDPKAKTALSNIEVIHKEVKGAMYTFKYIVEETQQEIYVATTRPETMFGDVCVVIHPDDKRYTGLAGMHVKNPANNDILPIIEDSYIDIEFGTGAMKCTPAHDPNDFAISEKYNLPKIICMNPDGTMNELAGEFNGMDRFVCREALVNKIKNEGNLVSIEEHIHQVGHSERTNEIVEPYLSKQWFVKMKPLAQEVLKNQQIEDEKIHFYPPRFEKTFNGWLENIEDWCISRQLWWGHRIPAWYHKDTNEIYVGDDAPSDIENWVQDEDVLDTWFSSALWPFTTLGWPEKSDDFDRYFPNDVLVTGYDIIFFWVARMAFQARYCTSKRPFKDVLIHGLVRDADGHKMSKSLGNGIDPMEVIEQYGSDALRFFLTTNSTPGQDLRFIPKKVEASWNFINKIWNASRFVLMNLEQDEKSNEIDLTNISFIDRWILQRLNEVIISVSSNMDKYEFALVGNELYNFIWNDFCSWYIELSKAGLNSDNEMVKHATCSTLHYVLSAIVRLLHPFMPYVSEEIYLCLPNSLESINLASWPKVNDIKVSLEEMKEMKQLLSMIEAVREIKNDYRLKPSLDIEVVVKDKDNKIIEFNEQMNAILQKMCHASIVYKDSEQEMVIRPIEDGTINVALADIMNIDEEITRLEKEQNRLLQEINRGKGMLKNEKFILKAPASKVEEEKVKLHNYESQLLIVQDQLKQMKEKI
ncbi:MAG: valine--tRNA ligase [Erysipelotrichaceae bacterium]